MIKASDAKNKIMERLAGASASGGMTRLINHTRLGGRVKAFGLLTEWVADAAEGRPARSWSRCGETPSESGNPRR
jgi:hypothetical protein